MSEFGSEFGEFGDRVKKAIGPADPDPGLRSRVVGTAPAEARLRRPDRAQWAMGAVALILTAAIAGGAFVASVVNRHKPTASVGLVSLFGVGDLKCRLPITGPTSAAYISFPDGGLSLEPSVKPVGFKSGGAWTYSYDAPAQAWIPVGPAAVSTDGRSYAYATQTSGVPGAMPTGAVHIVDVRTQRDREVSSDVGMAQVIGWSSGLLYLQMTSFPQGGGMPGIGIFSMDPANGALKRITPPVEPGRNPGAGFFSGAPSGGQVVGGGGAFSVTSRAVTVPSKSAPNPGGGYLPANLVRTDLRDGSQTTWYTAPEGQIAQFLGLDAQNRALVSVQPAPDFKAMQGGPPPGPGVPQPQISFPPAPQLVLVSGPGQAVRIDDGKDESLRPIGISADQHGLWLGTANGSIYLYAKGALRKVAVVGPGLLPSPTPPPGWSAPPGYDKNLVSPPPGLSGTPVRVAGPCV